MEFKTDMPIYLQIAKYVSDEIINENWSVLDRVPSVREMAIKLSVNPHTVLRAYEYLEANDIILNRRGIGFFISKNAINQITKSRKSEFFSEILPQFFATLRLLKIPFAEIEPLYRQFQENT
jgi:DNA-binding transcriptional regulator YhcF (GntR family)